MPGPVRIKTLERLLSKAGIGSRTEARRWIAQGRVTVDGRKTLSPDEWIDPERQKIAFDGKPLKAAVSRTLLLYKPKGYLTTYRDPQGRPTIYALLNDVEEKVFPAGRLDLDTSGLLIVTNENDLLEQLTNPDFHVPKTYLVKASKLLSDVDLDRLRQGIELEDGLTRPAIITRVRDNERYTFLEMTITEGRNRQVRRMIETLEAVVLKLVRTKIGGISIGPLQIGTWRELTPAELRELKKSKGGSPKAPPRLLSKPL